MSADRLRCENGEWKTRAEFSHRQLEKYDRLARRGGASPSKTGIHCTDHSNQPVRELKCLGPCLRTRDLRFFSKSTRSKGQNWCIDCNDWRLKTEAGEALPAPGGQLSAEEMHPGAFFRTHAAAAQEVLTENAPSEYDGGLDNMSTVGSTVTSQSQYQDRSGEGPGMRASPSETGTFKRAPHWLIPDMGSLSINKPMSSSATVTDNASVADSSAATVSARDNGPQRPGVPFNAWGPDGEFARKLKTPTEVTGSSRITGTSANTARTGRPVNLGRKGWARPPTRKQMPQLPDYLRYDIPPATNDYDEFDRDLEDDIIAVN
ncbi:uncharacterized protein C8A04DRAFT_9750 [Dichotomopilus funicola]|uniref:Stc1 domain-containing protein n=1 Tax=Dichotomopilus funicola TaxID=1934379 RepID=A0AAN6V838_9PEZI|nr:hypothetical protein C8A04DRAFT_9750 [Dichotomopilus funicola]